MQLELPAEFKNTLTHKATSKQQEPLAHTKSQPAGQRRSNE